jgi:hypothetical protein
VRHQISQNLQQESLGHFAVGGQPAARHGTLGLKLGELQSGSHGIRNGAGEFHE